MTNDSFSVSRVVPGMSDNRSLPGAALKSEDLRFWTPDQGEFDSRANELSKPVA